MIPQTLYDDIDRFQLQVPSDKELTILHDKILSYGLNDKELLEICNYLDTTIRNVPYKIEEKQILEAFASEVERKTNILIDIDEKGEKIGHILLCSIVLCGCSCWLLSRNLCLGLLLILLLFPCEVYFLAWIENYMRKKAGISPRSIKLRKSIGVWIVIVVYISILLFVLLNVFQ